MALCFPLYSPTHFFARLSPVAILGSAGALPLAMAGWRFETVQKWRANTAAAPLQYQTCARSMAYYVRMGVFLVHLTSVVASNIRNKFNDQIRCGIEMTRVRLQLNQS